jgi:ribose transport system permease protein
MKVTRTLPSLGFERFSGLYVWLLFIVVFGALRPHLFLTVDNLHSIASTEAIPAMLGLAVLVPLACGEYDLSIGANINLAAVLATVLQVRWHLSMWPAIVVAIAVGLLIGVVNGFIVVKLHVSSFIATLGMATILAAVQTIVTSNLEPLPITTTAWVNLTQRTVGGFQIVFWYLIIIALLLWWALEHMPFGRYIYAVGGNPEAARLSGVRTGKYSWLSLIICGGLSSLAGVFYGSANGPSLSFGSSLLLPAFAAAFLGYTQIRPGRFNVWGSLLAVFVLATGVNGLEYVTSVQWLNDMFNGVALIVAVAFAVWRQRARVEGKSTNAPDDGSTSADNPDGGPGGASRAAGLDDEGADLRLGRELQQ